MKRHTPYTFLLLAGLTASAGAQMPPPPARGPSPLAFVRFTSSGKMRVTFYPGGPSGRSFDAPAAVGMRPGYVYRVRISEMEGYPGVTLCPTVQVCASLSHGPKFNPAAYPAPVVLTPTDVERALAGSLVTKVVYLEDPVKAAPIPTLPDRPIEGDLPPGRDPVAEARELGRPFLVFRIGERSLTEHEMAAEAIPGTVLLPGERSLPPARVPPLVPYDCRPFFDPRLGPRPQEEECFHDGGDAGVRAGFDAQGRLRGVEPEDTVAEYTDPQGRKRVVCSNRVCLCVPRFAVLRTELPPAGFEGAVGPLGASFSVGQGQLRMGLPSRLAGHYEQPKAVLGRERPTAAVSRSTPLTLTRVEILEALQLDVGPLALLGTRQVRTLTEVERVKLLRGIQLARELSQPLTLRENVQSVGPAVIARVEAGPEVIKAVAETRDLTVCCDEAPCPPDRPLVLVKCADRGDAQIGDVVTFTLRYSNHGGRPLTDIAVTDSLTARLEYVPGSAQSDRDAVFTTQLNEAGSQLLRWEVGGKLLPGQGGTVRFRARIR